MIEIISYLRPVKINNYTPTLYDTPSKLIDIESAWKGHHIIIKDLIFNFNLGTDNCLEFGVEFGFSTVALSNYFQEVTGVDLFTGDIHTDFKGDHYQETTERLLPYKNIKLIKEDYKDWISRDNEVYNLIHVDIVHTYEDTFQCGLWSAKHSQCTIFHDTESFPEVKKAVTDIARKTGKKFYNYTKHHGLGILV